MKAALVEMCPPSVDELGQTPLPAAISPSGSETVLVVDDEEAVRSMAVLMLRKLGYTVLEAGSMDEARQVAGFFIGTIHLLLTDCYMPNGDGKDLANYLALSRPELRVIYYSGYSGEDLTRAGQTSPFDEFLTKPFRLDELATRVRKTLDIGKPPEREIAAPSTSTLNLLQFTDTMT